MIVISYLNTVIHRLISHDEFLPSEESSMGPFLTAINHRYEFKNHGESPGIAANIGSPIPVFQNGLFTFSNKSVPVLSLEFQPTRIVAACSTTEQAQALLDDVVRFLVNHHGFRLPTRRIENFPVSSLVVDFGHDFLANLDVLKRIIDAVNTRASNSEYQARTHLSSVRIAGSSLMGGAVVNTSFIIEERGGRPSGTSWLYTQAPLSNSEHIELLQDIQKIVSQQIL